MKHYYLFVRSIAMTLLLFFLLSTISYSQTEAFRVKSPTSGSLLYVQSDGSVAVDTSATLGSLTVNGNNGIIATGTFGTGTPLSLGAGTRMMWYPRKAAFRVGRAFATEWDDANIGEYSIATGDSTIASGGGSTAIGYQTTASGATSTAMGAHTTASGMFSTAMGVSTIASGIFSTAIGLNTIASGTISTAMGYYSSTNSHPGSFVYGDNSTFNLLNSSSDNQFMVRATGGYVFYSGLGTNTGQSTWVGATLGANQTAWSVISDSTKKEYFLPVNGEEVLNKISKFNLRTWNYKGQNPKVFRHYGPMAQEFFNAFGQDKLGTIGNDTTINSADFAGINLIAIQALEKRTDKLQKELNEKDKELAANHFALANETKELDLINANYDKLKTEMAAGNGRWEKVENMLNKMTGANVVVSEK